MKSRNIKSLLRAIVSVSLLGACSAWKQCVEEDGGGICPDLATCCPTGTLGVSSCISGRHQDPENEGVCCGDNTGCGFGFQCAIRNSTTEGEEPDPYCQLQDYAPPDLTYDVPRYNLCTLDAPSLQVVHGFPINDEYQVAYYSNLGDINGKSPETLTRHTKVKTVLIIVHGSRLNADDYVCGGQAAIPPGVDPATVLVVAPLFAAPVDPPVQTTDPTRKVLVWNDYESPPEFPFAHSFRYGANAIDTTISSFEIMDHLVEYLSRAAPVHFPHLERIVVTGHSAGGQYVQRWGLLSNSPVWRDTQSKTTSRLRSTRTTTDAAAIATGGGTTTINTRHRDITSIPSVRVVVANPRSFAFLTRERWLNNGTTFDIPTTDQIDSCPEYNQWNTGLSKGGPIPCSYYEQAIHVTPPEVMTNRYATRDVAYLAGEYDLIIKEDHCAIYEFQGKCRLERSRRFYASLFEIFGRDVHRFYEVESPHDHNLMYQSKEGQAVLFG
jgi:hypothetical protein